MTTPSWKPGLAIRRIGPLLIAMLALEIIFGAFVPGFWRARNQIDLMQQVSVNAILALGVTLTIIIGGIDLSVGAVLALVGTATVYMLTYTGSGSQSLGHCPAVACGWV